MSVHERFWAKVDKSAPGGCWAWTSAVAGDRDSGRCYGTITIDSRNVYAHRLSYEWSHGHIPDGMMVDHKCHNNLCVNPDHLRLATPAQNQRNLSGARRDSSTGLRNIKRLGSRWRVRVTRQGKVHEREFMELEDAKAWAREKRVELFGEFAGFG